MAAERWLLEELAGQPVIDAHEHLPAEAVRLGEPVDALLFFRQYTRLVMFSAGLDEATFMRLHDPGAPLDERFAILDRYRELIRASSAARAAYLALEHFYGEREVTRENFPALTERMRANYRPGLYRRMLREACGIAGVLQNSPDLEFGDPLMHPVPMLGVEGTWGTFAELCALILRGAHGFATLDEYLAERGGRLEDLKQRGVVAFKHSAHLYVEPDRDAAEGIYRRLLRGDRAAARTDVANPLLCYLTDQLLGRAAELGLPLAVHTGVWGDFRQAAATEVIPYIMRHPTLRFDLFHMGIPAVREMGRIGANFRNVWLNMCWGPTVSQTLAANALDEWIDQVAANKIIAFGGDVRWCVEKVYGHLTLAKEVVAGVLGRRIERGWISRGQALALARRWFLHNPAELYGVG